MSATTFTEFTPRSTGHCAVHYIPSEIVKLSESWLSEEDETNNALNYLRSKNADLVKGDLILFDSTIGNRNDGIAIFDGTKIVDLYDEHDEWGGCILPDLHVIENDVPLNYWQDSDTIEGIKHNDIVWFDHKLVREQCCENIKYGLIEIYPGISKYAIYTVFMFNGKKYRIIFNYCDAIDVDEDTYEITDSDTVEKFLDKCKHILMNDDMIVFSNYSEYYEGADDNKTLFVALKY